MSCLQLPDGRQLNYLDRGHGPVVVILHGWGMSSGIFTDLVEHLAEDFRVLVPDLRGHGRSDSGPGYALTDFASDIKRMLHLLDLQTASLIGWSLGGQVAMQLAAENKPWIHKLVVVSSTAKFCQSEEWPHGLPEVQVRAMERRFGRDPARTLTEFVSTMFTGENCAEAYSDLCGKRRVTPDPVAGSRSLETLKTADIRSCLPAISVPTLVHHGRDDVIVPVTSGQYLAGKIPGSECVVVDGVGHAPFISAPEQCLHLWRGFLL